VAYFFWATLHSTSCTVLSGTMQQHRFLSSSEYERPFVGLIPLSRLCGSGCSSLRFYRYFCRRKAAVVLRKVVDWLLTTVAVRNRFGERALMLARRSRCMELNARTHPCWTWHSCFQETVEDTSF